MFQVNKNIDKNIKDGKSGVKEKYPVIKGRAKSKDILTVPNALSILRILLIPLFLYLYLALDMRLRAAIVLAVSYVSDLADGIIARKCNMISDLGKMLDPLADKLTQASLVVCIAIKHPYAWVLLALFAVKEIATALSGFFAVRRTGFVSGAKWYGKVCTVMLNLMFAIMLFIPLHSVLTEQILMIICAGVMTASAVAYLLFFNKKYDK